MGVLLYAPAAWNKRVATRKLECFNIKAHPVTKAHLVTSLVLKCGGVEKVLDDMVAANRLGGP